MSYVMFIETGVWSLYTFIVMPSILFANFEKSAVHFADIFSAHLTNENGTALLK
jgi:hypothetical protein